MLDRFNASFVPSVTRARGIALLASCLTLLACGSDANTAASSSASSAPATKSSGAGSTGNTSTGNASTGNASTGAPAAVSTAEEKIDKELITCTPTGGVMDSYGEPTPEFECKSVASKDMKYVQFNVYYYDKDKQMVGAGPMADAKNAEVVIKAGETKKFGVGKPKKEVPPAAVTLQVEVSAGAYTDGSKWRNPKLGLPDRPMK